MSADKDFLKREIAKQNEISTGFVLLDRCFKIPIHSTLLIKNEAYSGATALCLGLASTLIEKNYPIFYIDINDSILKNRVSDLNTDLFSVCRPTTGEQMLELVKSVKNNGIENPVYILDSLDLICDEWDMKGQVGRFGLNIRRVDPSATVIATQRDIINEENLWSTTVSLEFIEKDYDPYGQLLGHLAKIIGPYGKEKVYISYKKGRISKRYELARLQEETGTIRTGTFVDGETKIRGFWSFVYGE